MLPGYVYQLLCFLTLLDLIPTFEILFSIFYIFTAHFETTYLVQFMFVKPRYNPSCRGKGQILFCEKKKSAYG